MRWICDAGALLPNARLYSVFNSKCVTGRYFFRIPEFSIFIRTCLWGFCHYSPRRNIFATECCALDLRFTLADKWCCHWERPFADTHFAAVKHGSECGRVFHAFNEVPEAAKSTTLNFCQFVLSRRSKCLTCDPPSASSTVTVNSASSLPLKHGGESPRHLYRPHTIKHVSSFLFGIETLVNASISRF
jgi:hypothetical protein